MATESRNPGIALVPRNAGSSGETQLDAGEHQCVPSETAFEQFRQLLEQEPFRVEFFQAVRLLERMEKDRDPVGYFVAPQGETLRFAALPTLSFPPSQLYDLQRLPSGQLKMTVQFMGLCAAVSALPVAYTELVLARNREKDNAMADFFDIFNHRMISLFYRGWAKYRFFIGYEKSGPNMLSPRLMDFLGLGTSGLSGRAGLPDEACLNYVGLLGRHARTASSLRRILEDYFEVPVAIHQFAGTWRSIPADNRTRFTGAGRASERLGTGVVAGDEVWDHHGRIGVTMGPMSFDRYRDFLPGREGHAELAAWLRFYSNGSYETEVTLVLERDQAPACRLGDHGEQEPRLGLVSWLKTKPLNRDPGDATYLIQ
jgi:type VI secretion system protein ImpH